MTRCELIHQKFSFVLEKQNDMQFAQSLCYCVEVALESINDSMLGLAYILFLATIAAKTVYHIVRFTCDVFLSMKLSALVTAGDITRSSILVQYLLFLCFVDICSF